MSRGDNEVCKRCLQRACSNDETVQDATRVCTKRLLLVPGMSHYCDATKLIALSAQVDGLGNSAFSRGLPSSFQFKRLVSFQQVSCMAWHASVATKICASVRLFVACVIGARMRGIAGCFRFVFGNCKVELTASLERSRKWFASPILLVLWQTSVGASGEHMGCCSSKAADEPEDPLTGTGICQKQLYPPHISPTGLQVQLSRTTLSLCHHNHRNMFHTHIVCCRFAHQQPAGLPACHLLSSRPSYVQTAACSLLSLKAKMTTKQQQPMLLHQCIRSASQC
jgi:hypothetical protein